MIDNRMRYAGFSTIEKNCLLCLRFDATSDKAVLKILSSFPRDTALKNVHWMLMLYSRKDDAKPSEEETNSLTGCRINLKAMKKSNEKKSGIIL